MRRWLLLAMLWLSFPASGLAADEPLSDEKARELVEAGIREFRTAMRSDDPAIRKAALDKVLPDKKSMRQLLGGMGTKIWPLMEPALQQLRDNSDRIKEEFDKQGDIESVELIDQRIKSKQQLKLIPKEVPVYRAVVKTASGGGGSGSYVILEGRMVWVKSLESIPEMVKQLEKQGKLQPK
jgi:hypothetical protein